MLTDAQILCCFGGGKLRDYNGKRCYRVLYENGVVSTRLTCQGHTKIENGKVTLHDTCGEPCSFVCDDAQQYQRAVKKLIFYNKLLEEVKR